MAKEKVLLLDIYGDIGQDWFGEGITASTIKKKIDGVGKFDRIQLSINSPGGDAFEGIAIKNLVGKQGVPVSVDIDGLAASAASIIAMAGDTITMRAGSMMMIHDAWSICLGNGGDMRKMADSLDKISASIASCYAQKTGLPLDQIQTMMRAETWLDADEAKAKGFATDVAEDSKPAAQARARRFKALAAFRHTPDRFKAAACQCDCAACMDGDCENCTHDDCDCENCEDCPMRISSAKSAIAPPSNLNAYIRRFELLTRQKFKSGADTKTQ